MEQNEQIKKSAEELIDELFMEEETSEEVLEVTEEVEKACKKDVTQDLLDGSKSKEKMEDPGSNKTLADQVKVAKPKKDDPESRPEEVSDVPDEDEDGKRAKGYDSIQKPNSKTPDVSPKGTFVKADTVEVSKEDFEFLKKAKAEKQEEELRKAKEEQIDLIKAEVEAKTEKLNAEVENLKKSLEESNKLVKAMASKPQAPKSITNIAALEKSFKDEGNELGDNKANSFSKSEILDACEELVKSEKISMEDAISFETLGSMSKDGQIEVEKYLKRKG
jgi:hypothetical protein